MAGLDSVTDLQRLGLERFHCTYIQYIDKVVLLYLSRGASDSG